MNNAELISILKKRVDKKSPFFVSKFPINALTLSEKEFSETIVNIRRGDVEDGEEEPIKVVYSIDTEEFNVLEGYFKIVNFEKNKLQYIPANIWTTLEPIVTVLPDDLLFEPLSLLSFPSLKEIMSKKGLKKIIKEIICVLKEGIGKPTPQQLIPDDTEELWRIVKSLPIDHAIQFSLFDPVPKGLLIILHSSKEDTFAATSLGGLKHAGPPDGKWHVPGDKILKILIQDIYDYGEHHNVYYSITEATPTQNENCIKEVIKQVLNKEIRLEPPVDVAVKESSTGRKIKDLQIRRFLPQMTDDTIVITINKMADKPAASYIQVDGFVNGQNVFSSNSEQMRKLGYPMPKLKYLWELPSGKYKLSDIKKLLKKKVSLPVSVNEIMTYEKLLSLTAKTPRSPEDNTNRIDRSKTVNVRSIPVSVEMGLEQWNFRYKSTPQDTVTDEPFEGHITFLKGNVGRNDNAIKLECKVDCGCPDYMYKFAHNNYTKGAGDIGGDSLNKCVNRSPKSSYDIGEGLCKHLVSLGRYLKTKIAATKKSNLFEAIGDVAKQGPFNISYYD